MQLPRSREIRIAFGPLLKEVKESIRQTNSRAAEALQRGRYDRAQQLMGMSKQIDAYRREVVAMKGRLSGLRGGGGSGEKQEAVPSHKLWEYFTPVLRCLIEVGGEGTRAEIQAAFQASYSDWLEPGDRSQMARGERWQVMVQRTRKPLLEEGWIEMAGHGVWGITAQGRRAAKKGIGSSQSDHQKPS